MKVKLLLATAQVPVRQKKSDAGYDLHAELHPNFGVYFIRPLARLTVPTGIAVEIPEGYYGKIEPRGGLALKGLDILGGVIDAGYRGEVAVLLINLGEQEIIIRQGDRIAQLVIIKIATPEIEVVEELSITDRGSNRYGSTGM